MAASGERPRLFLAALGGAAAFGPRAAAAANLLAAVGIAVAPPQLEASDVAAIVQAFIASGARAACLCGDATAYAAEGAACARGLRDACAEPVLVFDGMVEGAQTLPRSGKGTLHTLRFILDAVAP